MDSSLEHFKATLQRRKQRKEKRKTIFNKENLDAMVDEDKEELKFPEVSESKMKKIKEEIRKERKNHKLKEIVTFIILMTILFLLFFFLIK